MVHIFQTRQGVQLTKTNLYNRSNSYLNQAKPTPEEPGVQSNELHVRAKHISKL